MNKKLLAIMISIIIVPIITSAAILQNTRNTVYLNNQKIWFTEKSNTYYYALPSISKITVESQTITPYSSTYGLNGVKIRPFYTYELSKTPTTFTVSTTTYTLKTTKTEDTNGAIIYITISLPLLISLLYLYK